MTQTVPYVNSEAGSTTLPLNTANESEPGGVERCMDISEPNITIVTFSSLQSSPLHAFSYFPSFSFPHPSPFTPPLTYPLLSLSALPSSSITFLAENNGPDEVLDYNQVTGSSYERGINGEGMKSWMK